MPTIEMFPPSFNKLRQVLAEQHPDLWEYVGGAMVHDQLAFIRMMNEALGVLVLFETPIDEACDKYLSALALRKPYLGNKFISDKTEIEQMFGDNDAFEEALDRQNWERKHGLRH